MQLFAGLEPDSFAGSDGDLSAGPGIATDTSLSRLDGKDAEAAQFNAVPSDKPLL
jgi:hypothetical protein